MRNNARDQMDAQYPMGPVAYFAGNYAGKAVVFKIGPYRYAVVDLDRKTVEGQYAAWNLIEHFRAKYGPNVPAEYVQVATPLLKANLARLEDEFRTQGI